jgi:transcriptional regulator with XRE-family HTH domain
MTIGQRIKQRRKELGISADELGSRLGVHRTTVFRYESGYIEKLPIDILEPIAKALQTTPDYFFDWEEVEKTNDILADIIVRLRTDEEFSSIVTRLHNLDSEKLCGIKVMLDTFLK